MRSNLLIRRLIPFVLAALLSFSGATAVLELNIFKHSDTAADFAYEPADFAEQQSSDPTDADGQEDVAVQTLTALELGNQKGLTDSGKTGNNGKKSNSSPLSSSSSSSSSTSSMASSSQTADTVPPTAPGNLTASSVTTNSLFLNWSASTDNGGAVSYLIYQNDAFIGTTVSGTFPVSGLAANTSYRFAVRAKDAAGNLSSFSSVLTVKTSSPSVPAPAKITAGYFAGWSAYSGYSPQQVRAQYLTHLLYAFANIGSDLRIAMGDTAVDPANFQKLLSLKSSYPGLKALISVGGWSWSGRFSDVALTDYNRGIFADSVIAFLRQYGFDGVDIDWEYPVSGGLSTNVRRAEDKHNFTLLLVKLRAKLDAAGAADGKHYLVTFAGGAGSSYADNTELSLLKDSVDFGGIMTYDIHGSWDTYSDLNAPLYNPTETTPQYKWSADSAVSYWLMKGFPAGKLVMGVPFYGILYKGVSSAGNGLYSRYTSASAISYDTIASTYLGSFARFYHPDAKVPWLFGGTSFISYDDETSIAQKTTYIKNRGLAGAMAWELSQNKSGSLLSILRNGLN